MWGTMKLDVLMEGKEAAKKVWKRGEEEGVGGFDFLMDNETLERLNEELNKEEFRPPEELWEALGEAEVAIPIRLPVRVFAHLVDFVKKMEIKISETIFYTFYPNDANDVAEFRLAADLLTEVITELVGQLGPLPCLQEKGNQ